MAQKPLYELVRAKNPLFILIVGVFIFGFSVLANPTYEDFTTFEEFDPYEKVDVYPQAITFFQVAGNTRVYKDYGEAFFDGDFTHSIDFTIDAVSEELGGDIAVWVLGNSIAPLNTPDTYKMIIWLNRSFEGTRVQLRIWDVGETPSYWITLEKTYYALIERDESIGDYGQMAFSLYNDPERTDLIDSWTLDLLAKTDYRYLYALNSYYPFYETRWFTGYVENLDINYVPIPPPSGYEPIFEPENPACNEANEVDYDPFVLEGKITIPTENPNTYDEFRAYIQEVRELEEGMSYTMVSWDLPNLTAGQSYDFYATTTLETGKVYLLNYWLLGYTRLKKNGSLPILAVVIFTKPARNYHRKLLLKSVIQKHRKKKFARSILY